MSVKAYSDAGIKELCNWRNMQPSNKPSSSCTPLVWIGTRAAARRVCYYYCGSLETENTHITAKELMTVFPYWGKKRNTAIKKIQRFTSSHTWMNDATAVFWFFVAVKGKTSAVASLIGVWLELHEFWSFQAAGLKCFWHGDLCKQSRFFNKHEIVTWGAKRSS